MNGHACGPQGGRPFWHFKAEPPFTARHSAAQTALLHLLSRKDLSPEMITQMEKEAIFEARRAFAEALIKCGSVEFPHPGGDLPLQVGVIDVFAKLGAEQIDMVIEDTWNALRASMQRQSARGEVPFPLENGAARPASALPPPGYFINDAGHLLKKELQDDDIPF